MTIGLRIHHTVRLLLWTYIVFLNVNRSFADESCGELTNQSSLDDFKKVLQCLEKKIEALSFLRVIDPRLKCLAEDNTNAVLRGCVTAISGGSQSTVQVHIQNKSTNKVVIALNGSSRNCGSIISDDIGSPYDGYTGVPFCNAPQIKKEGDLKTFRGILVENGSLLLPGEGISVTYVHYNPKAAKEIAFWNYGVSFYVTEITDQAVRGDQASPVSLSFSEIRQPTKSAGK